MPTMNVNLADALAEFVEAQVRGGDFASQSEVARVGLRLLREEQARTAERHAILKREVARGLADAEAERFSTLTIEDVERETADDA